MPNPSSLITCLRNQRIASDIWECAFAKPEGFAFVAGQFILFDVPLVEHPTDIQPRAFSIASAPQEAELVFVFKYKEGGRASRWVDETLRPGMSVRIQGPFGRFFLDPAATKDVLMIATSTGVAPFRSQMVDAMQRKDPRRFDLLFGCRSEAELFWAEDLQRLSQEHPNVFVHIALTQPTAAWIGHKGRVQHIALQVAPDIERRAVYICGSPAMVSDVKQACLEQWNVPKEAVHAEGYI
jgi:ferredoxin-NADP reductase